MSHLSLLLRASTATLLLVLCLQPEVNKAEENSTNRQDIIYNIEMPTTTTADKEVTLKLGVRTELKECMVIKAYLLSAVSIDGSFNYKQIRCLCEDTPVNFFWDFYATSTANIAVVIDIVKEKNICPDDKAVVPITANRYYSFVTLHVN